MKEKLNKLIEKLYFLSHIPSNLGHNEISIALTQEELDLIVIILTEYRRLKEDKG